MKQQLQALGLSVIFFGVGTLFLFLARGYEYLFKFLGTFGNDFFLASGMVVVSTAVLLAVQQVILHLVVRRLGVDQ